MALKGNNVIVLLSVLIILLGVAALIEQYIFDNEFFKVSDVAHHEVIAVALWCLGLGILIGVLAVRASTATLPCPNCGQPLAYITHLQHWYCSYCRHYYKPQET